MGESASSRTKKAIQMEKDFLAAFDEHSDGLFRHCFVRLRDREVAKDVVQETFAKTWDYVARGKKIEHMRAFLYRVANNLIVDTVRRKRSVSLDNMIEADGFEVQDENTADPVNVPDGRIALKLLESLDEIYRTVVTMRFIDGLSPKEIAAALNISENVVSVRLYRGVERLKGIVNQKHFNT